MIGVSSSSVGQGITHLKCYATRPCIELSSDFFLSFTDACQCSHLDGIRTLKSSFESSKAQPLGILLKMSSGSTSIRGFPTYLLSKPYVEIWLLVNANTYLCIRHSDSIEQFSSHHI